MTSTTASRPGTFSIGWQRISIELKQFFRDRESVVFTFSLPMLLMLIFGSVFSDDIVPGVTFSQYFLAGMIASGVVYSAFQQLAIAIPMERDDGTLKRLQGTPMPKASYFLGKLGVVCVVYVAQVFFLLVIGVALFDVSLPDTSWQWLTFAWVSVLGLAFCTLLGDRLFKSSSQWAFRLGLGNAGHTYPAIHLWCVLCVPRPPTLDADVRLVLPLEMADARDAFGLSPRRLRVAGTSRGLGTAASRRHAGLVDGHRTRTLPDHVPLATSR